MTRMNPFLAVLIAALAVGIGLTASGRLYSNAPDLYGMRPVLAQRSPGYDQAMLKITELWTTDNYLEACVPIAAYGDERAYAWLESSLKGMAVSEAFVSSIKFIVGRRRPDGELDRKNSSFPSSHASSAFAFATVLASHYPEHGAKVFEIAFFVALSRIYLERHYPSDVIGGAAIGVAAAIASETYLSWLHFDRSFLINSLLLASGIKHPDRIETPLFDNR